MIDNNRRECRIALAAVISISAASLAAYDWPQMNGDAQHSGNNILEKILTASNVGRLAPLFQVTLPSVADGAPILLRGIATPRGTRDVLFLTTKAGHILALDAHTGASIWSHQYPAGRCISSNGGVCYTTSSPAIDPNRQFVYSYGLDGFVHKYQVGDGTEIFVGGWPELVTTKGFDEKASSALAIATDTFGSTFLYATLGGYPGDAGDYQGHVTAINLGDGTQKVFNTVCSDQTVHFVQSPGTPDCARVQSAVWARVGVVYDDVNDRIYMATGNGLFDGSSGGFDWGDSVLSLNPDGTGSSGKPLDSYTPASFQQLQNTDADLGSTAPAILPAPGFPGRLAVQGGKDANLRLLNLSNLSGQSGPGHIGGELQVLSIPQGCGMLTAPAVWTNPADASTWVFVTNGCGASALKLTFPSGNPTLTAQWQNTRSGFSPLVANNVLYSAAGGVIRAIDPVTGNVLWSDTTRVGGIHWESPVVANGILYITDESAHLTAYALATSDFNADARTDVVWRNPVNGLDAVWQMNGTSPAAVSSLPSVFDSNWEIAAVGDFNGDGRADLVWRNNSNGLNAIWTMNGTSVSAVVGLAPVYDTTWRIVGVGDFNGDGMPDLVWRNSITGSAGVWLMNGTVPALVVALPTVSDTTWEIAGIGDFNGDGRPDIVWRNSSNGLNAVWLMNGTTVSSIGKLTAVYDTSWRIAGVGDFNQDGMADLIWRNSTNGLTSIWLMDGLTVTSIVPLPTVSDTNWKLSGPR